MSLLTNQRTQRARELQRLFVTVNLEPDIDAEKYANISSALVAMVKFGVGVGTISYARAAHHVDVRSVRYGSPLEAIFVVGGSVSFVAGVALTLTKIANGLADVRVKLATARKILVETDEIRDRHSHRPHNGRSFDFKIGLEPKDDPVPDIVGFAEKEVLQIVREVPRGRKEYPTQKESESLIILSEYNIEIRVLDEGEDPHRHGA